MSQRPAVKRRSLVLPDLTQLSKSELREQAGELVEKYANNPRSVVKQQVDVLLVALGSKGAKTKESSVQALQALLGASDSDSEEEPQAEKGQSSEGSDFAEEGSSEAHDTSTSNMDVEELASNDRTTEQQTPKTALEDTLIAELSQDLLATPEPTRKRPRSPSAETPSARRNRRKADEPPEVIKILDNVDSSEEPHQPLAIRKYAHGSYEEQREQAASLLALTDSELCTLPVFVFFFSFYFGACFTDQFCASLKLNLLNLRPMRISRNLISKVG